MPPATFLSGGGSGSFQKGQKGGKKRVRTAGANAEGWELREEGKTLRKPAPSSAGRCADGACGPACSCPYGHSLAVSVHGHCHRAAPDTACHVGHDRAEQVGQQKQRHRRVKTSSPSGAGAKEKRLPQSQKTGMNPCEQQRGHGYKPLRAFPVPAARSGPPGGAGRGGAGTAPCARAPAGGGRALAARLSACPPHRTGSRSGRDL